VKLGRRLLVLFACAAIGSTPAAAQTPDCDPNAEWGYGPRNGPPCWVALEKPKNFACGFNSTQSPIDMVIPLPPELKSPLPFMPGGTVMSMGDEMGPVPLTVWNNGHTVQVNFALAGTPGGRWRTWGFDVLTKDPLPTDYPFDLILQQVHFHSPSEHTLRGQQRPLEAHLL
jgi:carbonic anhydrase